MSSGTLIRYDFDSSAFVARLDEMNPAERDELVRELRAESENDRLAAQRLGCYSAWKENRRVERDQAAKARASRSPAPEPFAQDAGPAGPPMSPASAAAIRQEIEVLQLRSELLRLEADRNRQEAEEITRRARQPVALAEPSAPTGSPSMSIVQDQRQAEAEAEREAEAVREWARKRNESDAPAAPFTPDPKIARLLRDPLEPWPEPERMVGVSPEAVERARSVIGDDREGVSFTGSSGAGVACQTNHHAPGFPPFFIRQPAEQAFREAAICELMQAGMDPDPASVDRVAGGKLLRLWASHMHREPGRLLSSVWGIARSALTSSVARLASIEQSQALGDEWLRSGRMGLYQYLRETGKRIDEAAQEGRKRDCLAEALADLPPLVASRVAEACELAGGAEKLVVAIREAKTLEGSFPGDDHQLARLKAELDEAAARMRDLSPPDGEDEGDLYRAAREKRDELVERVADRRAAVVKVAVGEIRQTVADALAGDVVALEKIQNRVRKSRGLFPEAFERAIQEIGLEVLIEVGGYAFSIGLS